MALNNPVVNYLRESKVELEKVSWPTRKDTVRYTLAVILFAVILGAFFAVVDQVFNLGVIELLDLSTATETPSLEISDIETTPVEVTPEGTVEAVPVETTN
jgi:preprotein translocase subunit SecE